MINITFSTNLVRWIMLIIAVWMLSRGLKMWRSQIGALLIFNVLVITTIKNLLMAINWVWQLAGHNAELVVEDPLADYFTWIGYWLWSVIWLLMIYGGVKIARDINAQFDGALLTSRRISVLLYTAVGACILYVSARLAIGPILWHAFPDIDQSNMLAYQVTVTFLQLANASLAIVFCVMLFIALRRVRRVLRSPTLHVCPKCTHTLHDSNAGRCPECGWQTPGSTVRADQTPAH